MDARKAAAPAGDLGKYDLSFDLGEPERYPRGGSEALKFMFSTRGTLRWIPAPDQIAQIVRGFMK